MYVVYLYWPCLIETTCLLLYFMYKNSLWFDLLQTYLGKVVSYSSVFLQQGQVMHSPFHHSVVLDVYKSWSSLECHHHKLLNILTIHSKRYSFRLLATTTSQQLYSYMLHDTGRNDMTCWLCALDTVLTALWSKGQSKYCLYLLYIHLFHSQDFSGLFKLSWWKNQSLCNLHQFL